MGLILSLILSLSLFVRGFAISHVPPELFGDEIDVGYQAYSLQHTGRDLYGQAFPTYIHSLSEWRLPLLMYFTVPSVGLFGLNEVGVRLPQVVFGSLAPVILFLLVNKVTPKLQKSSTRFTLDVRHYSALALALMPWHIIYSRVAFEVVIMLDLLLLGTLLFQKNRYFLSFIFFSLCLYCYSTAIVFVPIWLIIMVLVKRHFPPFRSFLAFLLAVPLIFQVVAGPARDRFNTLSIFNNNETIAAINDYRTSAQDKYSLLWHNKVETYTRQLISNYLRTFSSEFLFVRGDPTFRHSLQVIGQLMPITAPFLLLGIYQLLVKKQYLWLLWLILAPVPSIFTNDGGYHATRLFLMVPPLAVGIAYGFDFIIRKKPVLIGSLLSVIYMVFFAWVSHYYLVHYPVDSWRWWHVGFKTAMTEVAKISPEYNRVYINNTYEPSLIRFLFYSKYSPTDFQNQFTLDQPITNITPGYDGFKLSDKFVFGGFSPDSHKQGIPVSMQPGALYVISQRDDVGGDWDWRTSPPEHVKVLFTSTNPSGEPILYLVTRI